jgi:formylglycine-generating enzyme required for sulfatase activity
MNKKNSDKLRSEIENLEAAIAAHEKLKGKTAPAIFEAAMSAMTAQLGTLRVELTGSGAVAVGGSTALGENARLHAAPGGTVIHDERTVHVHAGDAPAANSAEDRTAYLRKLKGLCLTLPLGALGGDEGTDEEVSLDRVYVNLLTTSSRDSKKDEKEGGRGRFREADKLPALDAAAECRRLVLLGDPGSGKSSFVRRLAASVAAGSLGEGDSPAGFEDDLVPVFIVLRDLAPALDGIEEEHHSGDELESVLADCLVDRIRAESAAMGLPGFQDELVRLVEAGGALLLLDGMDEVPFRLRERFRGFVAAVVKRFRPKRMIATCRINSYAEKSRLPGFRDYTLAPFNDDQIRAFIKAWYEAQAALDRMNDEEATRRTVDLNDAASSEELRPLSENPMMLTSMAILHQRDIGLPDQRVEFYSLMIDVLLRKWQFRKWTTRELSLSPEVQAFLTNNRAILSAMEELALEAHATGRTRELADVRRGRAIEILEADGYLKNAGAAGEFLDYVDQRSGLLQGRGGEPGKPATYTFPHRTFQEYLTGCGLISGRSGARTLREKAGEGDYWTLAAQLGIEELYYIRSRTDDVPLMDLMFALFPETPAVSAQDRRAALWAAQIAVLVGRSKIERDVEETGRHTGFTAMLTDSLLDSMRCRDFPAHERARAGVALGRFGDPRPGLGLRSEQGVPDFQWCRVPEGPFLLGNSKENAKYDDEEPQVRYVDLKQDYLISRYPVTNAQFHAFVQDGGYEDSVFWTGEGWTWRSKENVNGPVTYGPKFNGPTHPVVGVSWYEAWAYCSWLHQQLRDHGMPLHVVEDGRIRQASVDYDQVQIRLPSEPEWEKAARGPDGITWPWGEEEPDSALVNGDMSNIEATSAVGCFPAGTSPCGAEEMSGNSWEWCATLWRNNYEEYEDVRDPESTAPRVLRGGSWYDPADDLRCAFRNGHYPNGRYGFVGFRVVCSPFSEL